ncbi:MAG: hypothetical protein WD182_02605 [Bacteroidota bacterium]
MVTDPLDILNEDSPGGLLKKTERLVGWINRLGTFMARFAIHFKLS